MIKLCLLIPETGPSGLWAPSARASAELAVAELNAAGGLLGRRVDLVSIDAGPTAASAAEAADQAVSIEEAQAVIGMFPSFARRGVARVLADRVPFLYTPQFEGFESNRSVVTTGETARELLEPAIRWLSNGRGRRRYFLCGSDYVWPRASLAVAKSLIRETGGVVTGEVYRPLGSRDHDEILSRIASTRTDVVLPYFLGADAIHFNRAFARAGLSGRVTRFTSAVDETILYGLGEDETENLFVSSAYFANLRSHNNGGFLERYHALHGDSPPPPNSYGQSCYEGVHCFASLAEAAGTTRAPALLRKLGRTLQRRTARGGRGETLAGGRQPIHLARVEGCELAVMPGL